MVHRGGEGRLMPTPEEEEQLRKAIEEARRLAQERAERTAREMKELERREAERRKGNGR
jgi:hypothetical protein